MGGHVQHEPVEMKPDPNPSSNDRASLLAGSHQWLASRQARFVLLGMAVCLSLPSCFVGTPEIGLDPSWQLSLQLATIKGKVFGREFVFTYGPLGYLLIHAAVSKAVLLLYDFFILASLLSIYRTLLPLHPRPSDAFMLIGLAVVTKICWLAGPASTLFTILCYWLWRVYDRGDTLAVAGGIIAAFVLFFGKVNYGLIMVVLIPAYAVGLLALHKKRQVHGILLLLGFPVLVWLGTVACHVDLPKYLRSGVELIAGYDEAMFAYPASMPFAFELACLFLLSMGLAVLFGRHRLAWREQTMLLPLIGLAILLLFKNAFTRSDGGHNPLFWAGLPLLLAVWHIGWRGAVAVRILLLASLFYPLALLAEQTTDFSLAKLIECLPVRYCDQLITAPWQEDVSHLQAGLRLHYPESTIPAEIKTAIGQSSVDVMPWESSIAVLNELNYQPRPIPQSYSAYTPWLDNLNARFLASTNAPAYILYACAQNAAIDARPAAWDESLTKMALLENYAFDSEFKLPMRVWPYQNIESASVFLLKHITCSRRLIPIATNEVSLELGESLPIPTTTNLVFLTLEVNRTILGKLTSAALSPSMLIACFEYQDGTPGYYRAVLPILKTSVLVNRRVESTQEIQNWLQTAAAQNMGVSSISFKTHSPWAFQTPFKGFLVEYRLDDIKKSDALR
jgi:hypothetical protein